MAKEVVPRKAKHVVEVQQHKLRLLADLMTNHAETVRKKSDRMIIEGWVTQLLGIDIALGEAVRDDDVSRLRALFGGTGRIAATGLILMLTGALGKMGEDVTDISRYKEIATELVNDIESRAELDIFNDSEDLPAEEIPTTAEILDKLQKSVAEQVGKPLPDISPNSTMADYGITDVDDMEFVLSSVLGSYDYEAELLTAIYASDLQHPEELSGYTLSKHASLIHSHLT